MPKIWLIGEALIDFVPVSVGGRDTFDPCPGGSPFNAAKAAARAGADACFLGAVSTDLFGEMLMDDLIAYNVCTAQTPRTDAPSTLAFVALTNGDARYAFFNNGSATATMQPDPMMFRAQSGDVVSCGSISLIDNPGADAIARFCLAQGPETLLCIDPNARPGMIADMAGWRARIDAIAGKAGFIRLSDEDLEAVAPGMSPDDFAAERLRTGTKLVLYTMGDRGVLGYCRAGKVQMDARRASVVDTVGAGDTLMGAVLAELALRNLTRPSDLGAIDVETLAAILRFAVTAASLNCETSGCRPPRRTDVLQCLAAEA